MVLNLDSSVKKSLYEEKIESLEEIEINDQDETNESIYKELLIYYMLDDQPMSAKFLWRRIPDPLKQDPQSELACIWSLVSNLIQRKYAQTFQLANQYKSSNKTWSSSELANLVDLLIENSRKKLLDLIGAAYSSINVNEFSNLFSLSGNDEAIKIALALNWKLDETRQFLLPTKKQTKETVEIPNQIQMEQLTSLVSFLEN